MSPNCLGFCVEDIFLVAFVVVSVSELSQKVLYIKNGKGPFVHKRIKSGLGLPKMKLVCVFDRSLVSTTIFFSESDNLTVDDLFDLPTRKTVDSEIRMGSAR